MHAPGTSQDLMLEYRVPHFQRNSGKVRPSDDFARSFYATRTSFADLVFVLRLHSIFFFFAPVFVLVCTMWSVDSCKSLVTWWVIRCHQLPKKIENLLTSSRRHVASCALRTEPITRRLYRQSSLTLLQSSNPYVQYCMKKGFRCCTFNLFIFPFQDRTSFAAPPLAAFLWRPQCGCVSLAVIPAARRWEASKPC